ncbi:hypothetical protein LCGC14_0695610 [marine sediment metagenome]|uniref:Ferritin/DPS domain-containing protein n=1 Tax=marine sediment metagenome TaxID=412755 RepID=A0A0F9TS06_9ZZZZ
MRLLTDYNFEKKSYEKNIETYILCIHGYPTGQKQYPHEIDIRVSETEIDAASANTALQSTLYELIDLYLAVHQLHWNVRGPEFYTLHDLIGDLHENLAGKMDMIAYRKLAFGTPSD